MSAKRGKERTNIMAKTTKKIDTKKVAKEELNQALFEALRNAGFEAVPGEDYGFKAYSIVVKGVNGHDVRLDLTTPKAKEATYDYVLAALADEDAE